MKALYEFLKNCVQINIYAILSDNQKINTLNLQRIPEHTSLSGNEDLHTSKSRSCMYDDRACARGIREYVRSEKAKNTSFAAIEVSLMLLIVRKAKAVNEAD